MTSVPLPVLMPALPEILLAVGAMVLLMIGAFLGEKSTSTITGLAIALLVFVLGLLVVAPPYGTTFGGSFVLDSFARFIKILSVGGSAIAIAMSIGFARAEKFDRFELPILMVLATVGMGIIVSARDMIALYMGVELMSLALYVIAAFNRDNLRSTEAGLKYFVLGALSSGMLLYGASLIYGFTGHVGFAGIAASIKANGAGVGFVFGLVFVLAGLSFKISAVPFHMWTPDVYEGAPTPITAFFAAAPKVAAMGMFLRIVVDGFGPATAQWQQVVVFIAIASMTLGAFAGIGQKNIKRLMAYSSIANMGFALVGLAAGTAKGVEGVILFMTIYLAMTLGAFAVILSLRRKEGMVEDMSELAGLSRTHPAVAWSLAILLFSLIGIPPLAGFYGKFAVFGAAVEQKLWTLAILGIITSAIGAYYYLRLIKIMFFDQPVGAFEPMPMEQKVVLTGSVAFVLLFVVFGNPLIEASARAAKSLF